MTITIKNAAPQAMLLGIEDRSGRAAVLEPEQLPQHLPHLFLFTERGPLEPQLVVGAGMVDTYGSASFDARSKFMNHQTVLANVCNENANAIMVQRLKPSDAPDPATIVFWLDLLPEQVEQYTRDDAGELVLDQDGYPQLTGGSVAGFLGKWVVGSLPANTDLGELVSQAGDQVAQDGSTQSTRYPIMAFQVSDFGDYGNRLGIRLSAPSIKSTVPLDEDVVLDEMAYLYRLQFVERPATQTTANVSKSIYGEQFIDFSFKEGTINRKVDKELWSDSTILQSYSSVVPGEAPIFGPFGAMHVYHDNISNVLGQLYGAEQAVAELIEGEGAEHIINFLTGIDYMGRPYHSYRVLGPSAGGALFSDTTTHYAQGGGDGTLSFEEFDSLVANQMDNYGELDFPFLDSALYPFSCYYDTGFTLETKKTLFKPIGLRKDVYVVAATQDASARQNTASEESSVAIALRAAARLYPESELYGTPACRALVIGHSGYLINSQYSGLLPLTIDFAAKMSKYAGASDGKFKSIYKPDVAPLNQVTMFKDVNCAYKPSSVRNRDWNNGLVWVQNFDRRSLFYPAFQTVYDDDTSVLNSALVMQIAVECQKVAERTWRELTGRTDLTKQQFIARSNKLIADKVAGRFDGRVQIVPETFYSEADDARGYSWSCLIHLYANNMKTVGQFTVTANRLEG